VVADEDETRYGFVLYGDEETANEAVKGGGGGGAVCPFVCAALSLSPSFSLLLVPFCVVRCSLRCLFAMAACLCCLPWQWKAGLVLLFCLFVPSSSLRVPSAAVTNACEKVAEMAVPFKLSQDAQRMLPLDLMKDQRQWELGSDMASYCATISVLEKGAQSLLPFMPLKEMRQWDLSDIL